MDILSLTNMVGPINAGDPRNRWHKKMNRPVNSNVQEDSLWISESLGIPSVNMKSRTEEAFFAAEKSEAFSDILRATYERRGRKY